MSAVGNPYDNAKAEAFFKTLKREEVYLNEYSDFTEAEISIERFIEKVYNKKRLHSAIGRRPGSRRSILVVHQAGLRRLSGNMGSLQGGHAAVSWRDVRREASCSSMPS